MFPFSFSFLGLKVFPLVSKRILNRNEEQNAKCEMRRRNKNEKRRGGEEEGKEEIE